MSQKLSSQAWQGFLHSFSDQLQRNTKQSFINFCKTKSLFIFTTTAVILSTQSLAAPLPTGGKVEAGQATISQPNSSTMNVNQSSQRAVVSWSSFDVAKGNTVNFNQPNAGAVTLNRVNSATPSMINGAVNANGQVVFVNPNGVVFGKSAEVNVGGMVATTMSISNDEFMAGKDSMSFSGGTTGAVVNQGRITVRDVKGFIALMAPEVRNEGAILATLSGQNAVALVSGQKVTLTFSEHQLVKVSVDASVINSLISNKRLIQVNGGQVIIAANSANALLGSVIKNTGTVSADGVNVQGGVVTLTAGTVNQSGTISANSITSDVVTPNVTPSVPVQAPALPLAQTSTSTSNQTTVVSQPNISQNTSSASVTSSSNASSASSSTVNSSLAGVGGTITLNGNQINLSGKSTTSATGTQGGGTINLGTSSSNPSQSSLQAQTVQVAAGAIVDVSATKVGNGGSINIWSTMTTTLAGFLNAKGGQLSGNGGTITTGSAGTVVTANTLRVDTSAPMGVVGNWIVNTPAMTIDTPTANVISQALGTSSVTINAGNMNQLIDNINSNIINVVNIINTSSNNINIQSNADIISFNNSTTLSLNALGSIIIDSNIQSSSVHIQATMVAINSHGSINVGSGSNSEINLAGAIIRILGSMNGSARGSSNTNSVNTLGAQNNSTDNNGAKILVSGTDLVYVGPNASIISDGDNGGSITFISNQGSVVIENALIQTNGGNGRGGAIHISGLLSTNLVAANIRAIGNTVGGIIKIGNDAQYGTLPFSIITSIDNQTMINAFSVNGPGGYIETSGHTLHLLSAINAGRGGIWLLDPTDIIISYDSDTATNISYNVPNSFATGRNSEVTPTSDQLYSPNSSSTSIINVDNLVRALNLGQVITITTIGSSGSGNGDISVNAPINSQDGSLTLRAVGAVNINQSIFLGGIASELFVQGAVINIAANVTTSSNQRYNGPVVINNNPSLNSNYGGYIIFGSTVDDICSGCNQLNLSTQYPAAVSLGGSVGATTPLNSLIVTGDSLFTKGSINTTGYQQYNVTNVFLSGDTTMTTQNAPIYMYSSVNESVVAQGQLGHSLTLDAGTSTVNLYDSIGNLSPIRNLTILSPVYITKDIVTNGNQTYASTVQVNGSVQQGSILTLSTPSIIGFSSTIDDVASWNQTGNTNLVIHGGGGIALTGNIGLTNIFKSITLDGPVQLYAPVTILAANAPSDCLTPVSCATMTFTSTIDASSAGVGINGLTLNAGTGTILIGDSIGYNNPLGTIELNSPVIFTKTSTTSIPFKTVSTQCPNGSCLYIVTQNSPITFNSTVDDAPVTADAHNLIISAGSSAINVFSPIGSRSPFGSLNVYGTANLTTSINTIGDQIYHNSVLLLDAVTINTVSGNVQFMANVTGNAASVTPSDLIQFLGNGDYIYQGITYTADTTAFSGTQIANVTFDANANSYQWLPSYYDVVKVLAVAGGGAGGGSGGGGGGGGVLFNPRVSLAPNTTYTIRVGAGGYFDPNGWPGSQGQNGGNSQFGTAIVALGGGGGGGCCWGGGNDGGSGGGSSVQWYNWGWNGHPGTSGLGTLNQGNAGTSSTWVNGQYWMGGGGGGAGSSPVIPTNGSNVANANSGNGGSGVASNITGTNMYYGGGGGASPFYDWGSNPGSAKSVGGIGGGGAGGYITGNPGDQGNSANWVAGTAGQANTGGGGGAGPIVCCWNGPGAASGGSGTVIIARPTYGQATDLIINSGRAIIGIENISNINNLSLSSSSGSSTPINIPLSLVQSTTNFTKGGTDTYVVNGLGNYANTLTVTGGVLSVINSPNNLFNVNNLVLNGGGLALDAASPQDLVVNNLSTYANSPITNAKTVTVNGVTNLGSSITSSGDQFYANDVTLWSNTTLTSSNGNVVFGGKVVGYISTLQFLGNGDYLFQDPNGTNTNGTVSNAATLPGGFILSYDSVLGQYGFKSAFSSQGIALIVGGGGAGALGGGGGGGVLQTNFSIDGNSLYSVVVGAGGNTNCGGYCSGSNGGDSRFGTQLIAFGGGGGGSVVGPNGQSCCWMSGYAGGSGGGGAFWNWTQGGSGVPGQGYSGGASTIGNGQYGQYWLAGGGGGAGGSPVNTGSNYTSSNQTGNGGIGLRSNITGTPTYYGGGGGGGSPDWTNPGTIGGLGGGGNGGYNTGPNNYQWISSTPGAPNTGGGGGGGWWCCNAANGGSGIVVLNIGIAPNLTIAAQPSINYSGILTGTNFSHIGVLTVNTSANFSLNAASQIASSAGLAKMGSGTLTLNNITSYAGSISVLGGTIVTPGLTGPLTMGSLYLANGGTFDLGTPSGQDLNLGSFTMVNGGNLLNINNLNVTGLASLSGNISTSGSQTYSGPVQISANVTVQTSGVAPITFNSSIDDVVAGTHTLTLNSGVSSTGMVNLNGVIGGTYALASLTINGPSSIGGAIHTTGNQTYNGDIRLIADTAMNAVTGNIQINGNVLGDAFYPGIIQLLGNGSYAYQTLGVNNNSTYTVYQAGTGTQAPGVLVSYDSTLGEYTWTANYNANINALIVGGGGAGSMGGGGGGGVIPVNNYATVAGTQYTVIVGAGGIAPNCCGRAGGNGGDSKFDVLIAKGGGGGGGPYSNDGSQCCWFGGNSGGSGGGASFYTSNPGGLGSPGQGYNGSNSITVGTGNSNGQVWGYWQAGGGGGAGGTGPAQIPFVFNGYPWGGWASNSNVGDGGPGAASSITGTTQYYGAGGAGGKDGGQNGNNSWPTASLGGIGGGGNGTYYNGNGSWIQPTSGLANTGSGGGGSYWCCGNAGNGGSGIVILDVPVPHGRASLYLSSNSGQAGISGSVSHINEFGYKVNSNTPSTIAVSQISDVLRIVKDGTGALAITGVSNFGQDISILAGALNLVGTQNQIVMNNLVLPTGALLNISNSTGLVVNGTTIIGGNITSDYGQTYSGAMTLTGSPIFTAGHSSTVNFGAAVNDSNFDINHLGLDTITVNGNFSAQSIGTPFLNTLGVSQQGIRTIAVSGSSQLAGNITTALGQSFNNIQLNGDVTLKNYAGNLLFGTLTQDVSGRALTLDTPSDKTINFSQISGISGLIKLNSNTITINNMGNYSTGSIITNSGTMNLNASGATIQVMNFAVGNDQPAGATVNLVYSGVPVNLTVGGTFTLGLNSVITKVNNLIVAGNAILRSNITTAGDQQYNSTDPTQSVRVGANMVLTSTTGNIYFAGGLTEYSNQTNYLKLLDNGNFQYSVAGNVVSGTANTTVTNISGLGMGITYANNQFNVTNSSLNAVSILIVGGGGAGGLGGGGGGGVNLVSTLLAPYTSYIASIGAGGTRPNDGALPGGNGGNSQFGNLTAIGGGGGGSLYASNYNCCWMSGSAGGSGGGASTNNWNIQGGAGTPGQGYAGGGSTLVWTYNLANNFQCCYNYWQGGGGGGAGGSPTAPVTATWPGQTGNNNPWGQPTVVSTNATGNGGPGLASNITGTTVYYAGGGGGGVDGGQIGPNQWAPGTTGGMGGGGNGAYYSGQNPTSGVPANTWIQPTAGAANTGGGGGGGFWCCAQQGSGNQNGGSGIIVVRQLSTLTINVGLGSSAGTFSAGPSASFQIGSLTVNSNNAFSLSANQIANSTLFTKGGLGTLSLSGFSSAFAKSVALIINGGSVVANHGSDTSLVMNSLTINNGSTFDLRNPSLVDLTINSLFMDSGAHLLGLNSLVVNQLASLGGSIITPGSQTYNGNMLLSGDTLIQTTGSSSQITLNASVDDLQAGLSNLVLTVANTTGAMTLNGAIGATQPIGSLTVNGLATIGTSINTVGDQTYINDLTLTNSQSVLNNISMSTVTGNVNFNGNVTGFKNTVLQFLGSGNYSINGASFNTSTNPASGISLSYDATSGKYSWNNVDTGNVDLLVVGGGGAGGQGGGGAGGVIYNTGYGITSGNTYQVAIGAGGTNPHDSYWMGQNGGNSQFGSVIAIGGGGGGAVVNTTGNCPNGCWLTGAVGGSGGGAPTNSWNQVGGLGTASQGNQGGGSTLVWNIVNGNNYGYWQAGGGGGAGGSPQSQPTATYSGQTGNNNPWGQPGVVTTNATGVGGIGQVINITGSPVYYAGGGGGGVDGGQIGPNQWAPVALGGLGGGGNGAYYTGSSWVVATNGVANTGGGGGGSYWCCGQAGSGGSGVVILNGTLASFSRANLSITTNTGLIHFASGKVFNNIGTLSIFTNRNDQTLSTGIVTNANTTGLTTGGTGTVTISGLSNYTHTISVMGGTLSLINSPSNTLSIDTLVLQGGGLALDASHPQDLTINNLTTYANSPITNAQSVTVTGQAYLGSSISSIGNQTYNNDVILWADTTLTSVTGNVNFGGKIIGFSAALQFLGNGQYVLNNGQTMTAGATNAINLGGGLSLTYAANGQYSFGTQFVGTAQILLVGGGGAGALGGGGGGGVLLTNNFTLGAGSLYTVVVGAGGTRPNDGAMPGGNGGNSQFGNLVAVGGGGGGSLYGANYVGCCWMAGNAGGSGGGGSENNWNVPGGAGTHGQGFAGGGSTLVWTYNQANNFQCCYAYWQAGGGGGASGSPTAPVTATWPGQTGNNNPWGQPTVVATNATGNGGAGLASNITGTTVYYGGGGGGGVDGGQVGPNQWAPGTTGGIGGGGNGGYYSGPNPPTGVRAYDWIQPTAGTANTGGGGGGAWWCCAQPVSQSGGSGIVALQIQNTPSLTLNVPNSSANPIGVSTQFQSLGVLTVNTNTNFALNAIRLTGTQGFIKGGSSTLTLTQTNSYGNFVGVTDGKILAPDDGTRTIYLSALHVLGGTFDLGTNQNLVLGGFVFTGGNLLKVDNITVNGSATIGGVLNTEGSQVFNGPVQIASNAVFETQNGNSISFYSTINDVVSGTHTMVLSPSGTSTIRGELGELRPLLSLTVNGASNLGGTINTTGNQTYNGDVTLVDHTSLNSVNGNITINGNVLGDRVYQAILQFFGLGNYRYQGVNYVVGSGSAAPAGVQVDYDPNTDTYTWTAPYDASINALLVGGGGAGGMGGGGGGGVQYLSGIAVGNGQAYQVIVGAGGNNGCNSSYCSGNNGGNSQFAQNTAVGGGGGGGLIGPNGNGCCWLPGQTGGSAGGNAINNWDQHGTMGTLGQGSAGGGATLIFNAPWCQNGCYAYWQSGGGGGAGGTPTYTTTPGNPWGNPIGTSSNSGGNGGAGIANNITGQVVYYAAGGGGGKDGGQNGNNSWPTGSPGGIGGGGEGSYYTGNNPAPGLPYYYWTPGGNGQANTGSGGGGGGWCCSTPGNGGSGVVILSIPVEHGVSNLSLNSGTGQYFINGTLGHIGVLSLASNTTNSSGSLTGSAGIQWSRGAVTISGSYLSDVQGFTKNGVDAITITNLRRNFGDVTVNYGSLYLPRDNATNNGQFTFGNLTIGQGTHLVLTNITDLTVTGNTYLGNNLDASALVNQTYQGAVTLGANVALSALNSITFHSAIDSANNGTYGLYVTAPREVIFGGNIGSNQSLAYFVVDSNTAQLPASVTTSGDQVYKANLILNPWARSNITTLTASGANSNIYLLGTVDGANQDGTIIPSGQLFSLNINATNGVYIMGHIGQNQQIDAFTVNATNAYVFGDVYSGNGQTYNADVWIGGGSNVAPAINASLRSDMAVPVRSALTQTMSGVNSSFLANQFYTTFNYNYQQWHSHVTSTATSNIRTLISLDPFVTFNGNLNDYDATPTHTLLVAAIAENWQYYPQINFNKGSGNIRPLASINAQVIDRWDPYGTFWGSVNFNNQQMITASDQTYRTDNVWSMARNYQPIQHSPPGKLTLLTPFTFNPTSYGITNGSTPGFVRILVTSPPTIDNPSTTSTVAVNGTPTGETSFSGGSGFSAPSSGTTSTGGGSSGVTNSSGGNSSSGGTNSGGNNSGGGSNAGGGSNSSGGSNSGGSSSGSSTSSSSTPSTSSGSSSSSSGGTSIPPVKVVEANSPAPAKSGDSLGAISLGGLMSLFGSSTNKDSVPTLAADRAPLGVAVVEVGGLEQDEK
ncbi:MULTISPECIES: glycine-rich domain-containing protein [unclassified Polynucleobacter]|uniref:glycine-rich domain-containing protein n=1 Tax=unclassified Polynucleobacter TaxID=2640945 RepID=UPI0024913727|nr:MULTISPECIES: filamentous hemagglutinin N-terminal domain-containing protein [unclassified Polynucleobacter]